MTVLLSLLGSELAFGNAPLLDGAEIAITSGERIGLIGRNGTGKSTLLKVLAGTIDLDEGRVVRRDALHCVLVEQEPELPEAPTLRESLALRADLERIGEQDDRRRWQLTAAIERAIDTLGLDAGSNPQTLSGGQAKRAALALAFAMEPDLLMLDEPTNHLDIAGIEQLEQLIRQGPTLVVITHDRRFLDNVATRIVELDRGLLRSFPGGFSDFERARASQLESEATARRKFDKFWAQEEVWIRKGIEARRTRNEGRVRRLDALRNQREARRDRAGNLRVEVDAGERSGKLVAELDHVGKSLGGQLLVDDLELTLMRGDRLGLVGANGSGKSTLLKLIVGELEPDAGKIRRGTNLTLAYFDQLREQLDEQKTVSETVSPGSDHVEIGGSKRHIMSYLQDFLFSPRQANSPVRMLSGGERNRLLLARLFARPANWLIMDEPTNDLDLESIELLESTLQTYPGTLILVSHDRSFLDNVVTSVLVAQGEGKWMELPGGYSDWIVARDRMGLGAVPAAGKDAVDVKPGSGAGAQGRAQGGVAARAARPRLSFKEQRELERLPEEIETLEQQQHRLVDEMADPVFFKQAAPAIRDRQQAVKDLEAQMAERMARWEALLAKETG